MDNAKPSAGMSLKDVLAARKAARGQESSVAAPADSSESGFPERREPSLGGSFSPMPLPSAPSDGESLGQKLRDANFNPSQGQPSLFEDHERSAPRGLPQDPFARDDRQTEPSFIARDLMELNPVGARAATPLSARLQSSANEDASAPWSAGAAQKSGAQRLSASAKTLHSAAEHLAESPAAAGGPALAGKPRASRLKPLRATQELAGTAVNTHKPISLEAGGLAGLKGENGWPKEMELFAKAELPTIKIPSFSDEENPARRRFLNRMLRFATHEGREDIAEACVKLGAPASGESERDDGSSLMGEVASLGSAGAVNLLLKLGADPNELSGEKGLSPLMWAAFSPQPLDTARALIAHGADVNTRSAQGKTALIQALEAQNKIYASFLLQKGASAAVIDHEGQSALALACALGADSEELTMEILASGVPVDEGVFEGRRPIEWAIARGEKAVVIKLLELGVDSSIPARDGSTLVEWAKERSQEEISGLLAQT